MIDEVYEFLNPSVGISDIDIELAPPDVQYKIRKALADYRSRNYITHNEMKQKLKQGRAKYSDIYCMFLAVQSLKLLAAIK